MIFDTVWYSGMYILKNDNVLQRDGICIDKEHMYYTSYTYVYTQLITYKYILYVVTS